MYHKANIRKKNAYSIKKQSGSAIIIAIFVIIVISLLGAGLMSLQRDSAESTSYEVYAARAYLSAYSASEIGLAQIFPLQISGAVGTKCEASKTTAILPDTVGFHGCSADYSCTSRAASAGIPTIYTVVSEATCKNSQINTRRQITVEASSL